MAARIPDSSLGFGYGIGFALIVQRLDENG